VANPDGPGDAHRSSRGRARGRKLSGAGAAGGRHVPRRAETATNQQVLFALQGDAALGFTVAAPPGFCGTVWA